MQLSRFTDLGLRVLMYLCDAEPGQAITIAEVAERFDVPHNHLAKVVQFMGQHPSARDAAAALQCRYLVHTSIDDEAPEILLVAHLTDAATEQVMWESEYRGAREDIRGLTRRMAGDISAAILAGGPVR